MFEMLCAGFEQPNPTVEVAMVGALKVSNALDIGANGVNIVQRGINLVGQLRLHVLHPAVEGAKHMQQRLVKDLLFTLPFVVATMQAEHVEVQIVEGLAQALDRVKELGARRFGSHGEIGHEDTFAQQRPMDESTGRAA